MKKLQFAIGLGIFIGCSFLEFAIPAGVGFLMTLAAIWPKATSHYHW